MAPLMAQSDGGKGIAVEGKILNIDPVKGDVSVRLEFLPDDSMTQEDGTLKHPVKLDLNSSNGKQEISFEKGKRMPATEAVLNMYGGDVNSYPFDIHKANLILYFTAKPEKDKSSKPKPAEAEPAAEPGDEAEPTEPEIIEIPFSLNLDPTMSGYAVTTTKSKDSDASFVDLEINIARAGMVKFFSIFVMLLMWGVSLAVLGLVLSVVFRDRKVEIAMFSFIATLLFAFVAVRNSQPAVPPIGLFTDYISFFIAEIILAICLLTVLVTWIFRPAK
jgi:hypothetical protein